MLPDPHIVHGDFIRDDEFATVATWGHLGHDQVLGRRIDVACFDFTDLCSVVVEREYAWLPIDAVRMPPCVAAGLAALCFFYWRNVVMPGVARFAVQTLQCVDLVFLALGEAP